MACRIAARSAWRAKGRTILIGAMVGLPMMGLAAADTLYWTADLTVEEKVNREYGTADYVVTSTSRSAFYIDVATAEVDKEVVRRKGLRSLRAVGAKPVPFFENGVVTRDAEPPQPEAFTVADLSSPLFDEVFLRRSGKIPVRPDEVVVTPELLKAAGASVGGTMVLNDITVRIVGTAIDGRWTKDRAVIAPRNTVLTPRHETRPQRRWLVDRPAGLSSAEFAAVVEASGLGYRTHEEMVATAQNQADAEQSSADAEEVGVAVVVVGLAALQIVLLASAGFAVGARRQRRDLGLVAAQGGDRRQVRSVVLASALVIGAAASAVAITLGVTAAAVLRGPIETVGFGLFGPFEVSPRDLAAVIVIGTVTALLAAALPARTASRIPVLAALTGRRGEVRTSYKATVVGVSAVVAGIGVAVAAARPPANFNLILAGAVVAEIGFALCASGLIALAGRTARWLPLSLRLATRDSARNRGRSAPAVAAIMAALAATVGLSVFMVSVNERDRELYLGDGPQTLAQAYIHSIDPDPAAMTRAAAAVAAVLPDGRAHRVRTLGHCSGDGSCTEVMISRSVVHSADFGATTTDLSSGSVAVGDAALAGALAGVTPGEDIQPALDRGELVTIGFGGGRDVSVVVNRDGRTRTVTMRSVELGDAEYYGPAWAVVSPAAAERFGELTDAALVWSTSSPATPEQLQAATSAMNAAGLEGFVERDHGFRSDLTLAMLALLGVSALVTLGATAIATGLAAAEARPDLATLAAVGASPRVRRVLSMAQAASVAILGALLGVLAGLVPAFAILRVRPDVPFVIPWAVLGVVVVGLPLLAALLAGLFTRSRLPMVGRLG